MSGRDPHEPHRVATPLELLFDLTFVIAFGTAASELAHALAADHVAAGLTSFIFVTILFWFYSSARSDVSIFHSFDHICTNCSENVRA